MTIGTRESEARVKTMLGGDRPFTLRPSRNPSVRSRFPASDRLFELTYGQCSCDLLIRSTQRSFEHPREKQRAKYERRGFSPTKIARAMADWEAAHERIHRRVEARREPGKQFFALLRELAGSPGGLRVLVHFYSGQFDDEEIRATGRVSIGADLLVDATVLAEDTLVEIVPRAG